MPTRADIREEIDRLGAHIDAARALPCSRSRLAASSNSWRRNSIARPIRCAPSRSTTGHDDDRSRTQDGVDQLREQIQNLSDPDPAPRSSGEDCCWSCRHRPAQARRRFLARCWPAIRSGDHVDVGDDTAPTARRSRRQGITTLSRPERFAQMRDRDELLECAEVFGNLYGTPRRPSKRRCRGTRHAVRHRLAGHATIVRAMLDDVVGVLPCRRRWGS